MSALRDRVMTAVLLIPVVILAILYLPTPAFALLAGAFAAAGAWEWAALAGWGGRRRRATYAAAFAGVLGVIYPLVQQTLGAGTVLVAGSLWWLLATVLVVRFQAVGRFDLGSPLARGAAGWLVLLPAWAALVVLHAHQPQGPWLVVFLMVTIWCADSAAYFVGRRWGRRRLASRVSPGKSWEGALGGVAAVLLLAAAVQELLGFRAYLPAFLALVMVTALASILGDLLESLYKRQAGIKDSGSLFPGHGGVLDRIDSLTSAAPLFVLGLYGMGRLP